MNAGQIFSIIGAALGVIAIVVGLFGQRRFKALRAVRTVRIADLAGVPLYDGRTCVIQGVAEPGPAGILRAPMSGMPCVWFHNEVTESFDTDPRGHHPGESINGSRTLDENTSMPQIRVRDRTGVALVDFTGGDIDRPLRAFHLTQQPRNAGGIGGMALDLANYAVGHELTYEEYIVRPGQPIYARGKAGTHPESGAITMAAPDEGPFIVSTRSDKRLKVGATLTMILGYVIGAVLVVSGIAGVIGFA